MDSPQNNWIDNRKYTGIVPRITSTSSKTFEKFLIHIGCTLKREGKKHKVYSKPGLKRPIIVPRDKNITIGVIQSNLRTLNINREEYLEIICNL